MSSLRRVALAGMVAAALVASACSGDDDDSETETGTDATERDADATTTTTAGQPVEDMPSTNLPADVLVRSSSWISPETGWVLVQSECDHDACAKTSVGHTTDGTATWQLLTHLEVDATKVDAASSKIRFADEQNGYAIAGGQFLMTTDGGLHWEPAIEELENSQVNAVEVADGTAWALVAPLEGGSDPDLYFAPVGTKDWEQAPGPVNSESAQVELSDLAVHGPNVFVGAVAGEESTVFTGTKDAELQPRTAPAECGGALPLPAPWSETGLFIVCSQGAAAGSVGKLVFASTDGGETWNHEGDAPLGGMTETAAAASESTVAITAASGGSMLYASFDGGAAWETPVELGDGGLGLYDLGFTSADVGVAVHGQGDLYRTTDGGHTWTPVEFG